MSDYVDIAESETDQLLGSGGIGMGQQISHVIVFPATTSPGAVSIKDGSNATTIFGIRIYQTGFQNFDFGGASAYSVWLFAAALVVFILYSIVNRRAVGSSTIR